MTVLIISIVIAWIIFSALLVTIICVNSARLSRIRYQRQIKEWAEAYEKDAIHMTQEQFDEIYNDVFLDATELE